MQLFKPKNIDEIIPRTLTLQEAGEEIVHYLINVSDPHWISLFEKAKSGIKEAQSDCYRIITGILTEQKITVEGYSHVDAAENIFRVHYGLGELDNFYTDPDIDEIRIAPNGKVYVINRGKLEMTDLQYEDHKVSILIDRLKPIDDVGSSLDEGSPMLELVRPDGFRLTALCRPVTRGYCLALRKHGNFPIVEDTFIQRQTFDEKVGRILKILVKGRRNILVCGGVNSGKTTLLKYLASELDPRLSIRVLDTDNELRLSELHPDREIWELEAHPEVGADMKTLFARILRITPDVVIVPEFRGIGEVWTTIEACTRGHDGSMATAHFSSFASPEEAIRNTAMLAIQEGAQLPLELVIERVAQSFQIIVQTYADTRKGIKKVTAITEVCVSQGSVTFNPLIKWTPYTDDYTGIGEWAILNTPTPKCCNDMRVYGVRNEDIQAIWGDL